MGDMNFSLTTFNKTGKLMQIEYALNRVAQGKMALGIKGKILIFFFNYYFNDNNFSDEWCCNCLR
jgi:hypothetical protein